MKKSLLLIALLVISVSAFAAAPNFPDMPDLKLTIGTGLTPAFDIECFNTSVDKSTAWAQGATNFNTLSSVSASWAVQGGYGAATVGNNSYNASNAGGTVTATNKVKWSTYRINKLPNVGLNVGASVTINVGSQVSPAGPASFGSAAALIVSDPTKVTAAWVGTTQVTISLISAASAPVFVDVIAAPVATPGGDQDKERITVYPNLFGSASFTVASDTSSFGAEISKPTGTIMTIGWSSTAADGAGTVANGVMVLTAADANQSYKGTSAGPHPELSVQYVPGQWYTSRMRYAANVIGTNQIQIWNFSNLVDPTKHVDVATDIRFGADTVWTWVEAPIYSTASGLGYPQIQIKPGAAVTVNIDEVQIINAAPTLISPVRGCDKVAFAYGDFDVAADTTQWGAEAYVAGQTQLAPSVANGALQFAFTAGGVAGAKWTAGPPGAPLANGPITVGKQVGTVADFTGTFTNSAGIFLSAVYGLPTQTGAFTDAGGQIIASAGFFGVTSGKKYAVANGRNPYYQFQFGIKTNESTTGAVDNVYFLRDADDPNFGDGSLYP